MTGWQLNEKFDVILCDAPWRHANRPANTTRARYPLMSLEEICALPVQELCASDCVLFLWACAPLLPEALKVMQAYGFTFKTSAIWDKVHKCGIGYWFRNSHELLLVGTRGKPKPPAPALRVSSIFREQKTEHSRKPICVKRAIRRMFPDARIIELFAREPFEDFTIWGNESDGIGENPLFDHRKETQKKETK